MSMNFTVLNLKIEHQIVLQFVCNVEKAEPVNGKWGCVGREAALVSTKFLEKYCIKNTKTSTF